MKGPTLIQSHTLDPDLSHGLPVTDIDNCDFYLSDHKPVTFIVHLPVQIATPCPFVSRSLIICPATHGSSLQYSQMLAKHYPWNPLCIT